MSILRTLGWGIAFLFAATWCMPVLADPNPPSIRSTQGAWKITRQWTPAETQHYAAWMQNIYRMKTQGNVDQRIAKLERVLTDPEMNLLEQPHFLGQGGNPQLPLSIIRSAHSVVDCAKLTSFLPAYYAYRRGLPWMVSSVHPVSGGDVRTSTNLVGGTSSSFRAGSLAGFFRDVTGAFNSGNYRVELTGRNAELSDTVPVAIDKQYLLPGTANYTDGHCLILGEVDKYGELHFLNSSTTPTRDIFTYNGLNTVSGITPRGSGANPWEGCFQGLRVWRYPIAEVNSQGVVTNVGRPPHDE